MPRGHYKHLNEYEAKRAAKAIKRSLLLRNRQYVVRAKSKPCADCRIQYNPWVMQFDHRRPEDKTFNMSDVRNGHSLKQVQAEIDKCDVVCGNCHLERTYRNKQWLPRSITEMTAIDVVRQGELFT